MTNSQFNSPLSEVDPEIALVLEQELGRQRGTLEMIASENFVPRAVLEAQARGIVDPDWDATELFTLLFTLATTSVRLAGVSDAADAAPETVAGHRAAAVRAAAKLIAP